MQSSTDGSHSHGLSSDGNITARDKLVAAICNDPDLPALGSSISRVVRLSSSDESIQQLAYFVLSDVSLTQKILRLANSITFRTTSGQIVTSISRAIFLLGFDTVKTCALAMILVDGMSGKRAESVRIELTKALAASMIGRELAKRSYFKDAEEIAVAALFKNMGCLLIAAHDHKLYQKMMKLVEDGSHTEAQASMEILGFNLNSFTETILEEWDIPVSIIRAMKAPPVTGVLRPPKTREEWMQQAVDLSKSAVPLVLHKADPNKFALDVTLLRRFGKALNLDKTKFDQLIVDAKEETRTLSNNAQLMSPLLDDKKEIKTDESEAATEIETEEDVLTGLFLSDGKVHEPQVIEYHPSGKPFNAQEQLLAGVQEISEMMAARQYKINDLFLLALEILYNSLGFRFVTICLKEIYANKYRARYSLGENDAELQRNFIFSDNSSTDIFSLAMKRNVDLMIADASTKKVRDMLPRWHRSLLPDARSFIVLPLVVNERPIGLFYADRKQVSPEGITADEMKIIKTIKRQVMSALSAQ